MRSKTLWRKPTVEEQRQKIGLVNNRGKRKVEINESERKKEKRIKRHEDNLRDLWDNVKCPNIRII